MVDLKRCLACRTCELACARVHAGYEDLASALDAGTRLVPRIRVRSVGDRAVPVRCQHCADAPCVAVCPSGALYEEEGTGSILTADDKCIGCKACVRVCPFGAVRWDEEAGCIIKCDLCEGLLEEGQEPYCVSSCPSGALILIKPEQVADSALKAEFDAQVKDTSGIGLVGPQVTFTIDPDKCICCGRCAKECPVDCITGRRGKSPAKATEEDRASGKAGEPFRIDQARCVKCGSCFEVCPVGAVTRAHRCGP